MSTPSPALLRKAAAHLTAASPELATVVRRVGKCTLTPEPDIYRVLTRAVIAQLISTAAAKSISGRLIAAVKGELTPRNVLQLTDDQLRACGIARGKAKAVRGIAEAFVKDRRFAQKLAAADDATARELLVALYGVGHWTVDIVLMFSVPWRADVLPVGDLGVRAGVKELFGLETLPTPSELTALAEPWRPYRTVASWYIWRSRGWAPQSTATGNADQ
jgi:DNA-3-methyladenine glycosylase II